MYDNSALYHPAKWLFCKGFVSKQPSLVHLVSYKEAMDYVRDDTGPLFSLFKSTLPLYFTISDIVHVS